MELTDLGANAAAGPELVAQMLQEAPDALLLVNDRGLIVAINAAATTLFGYPPTGLLGQAIELLVPQQSRDIHQRFRHGFEVAPTTREMAARLVALSALRHDGSEFPAEIRLAPIQRDGERYVLAAVRDVTDRRRMTDELRAARAEADGANKAKTRFLATASHDLRQPLQTLQLLNAALSRKLEDPQSRDLVQRQQAALDSMADLLNSLLDITKLESGAVRPNLVVVPLMEVLADIRRQSEDLASARGLSLLVPATRVYLSTDRVLLRQLLQNLITNALQYTREGSVTLAVRHEAEALAIEVSDTGIGIPDDEIDRVFDEYYRVNSPDNQQRGFGLGLTIVRQISRLLGYRMTVESMTGRGTTFAVHMPLSAVVDIHDQQIARSIQSARHSAMYKPAILIVEDDTAVRDALELVLGLEGYPTRVAACAEDAEQIFASHGDGIDVVVSDYHLPSGRNGVELLDSLRVRAQRDLPAVILSGDTSSMLADIESLSRVSLLRKPVDAHRLVNKIEELFGGTD
ncbi:MAG: ATP-binding protein [Gammaproteobacteria bacterium]